MMTTPGPRPRGDERPAPVKSPTQTRLFPRGNWTPPLVVSSALQALASVKS